MVRWCWRWGKKKNILKTVKQMEKKLFLVRWFLWSYNGYLQKVSCPQFPSLSIIWGFNILFFWIGYLVVGPLLIHSQKLSLSPLKASNAQTQTVHSQKKYFDIHTPKQNTERSIIWVSSWAQTYVFDNVKQSHGCSHLELRNLHTKVSTGYCKWLI